MDLTLRTLIVIAAVIAMLQYGRRVGAWWSVYTRAERVNRVGFGLLLLAVIEGSVEAVIVGLPTGPRNGLFLLALVLIVGGYAAMRHHGRVDR